MPRALVTGGAGFIGSHVADLYLEHGYEVTVLDNFASGRRENLPARAKLVEQDLTTADAARVVREGSFDVVSHLGAQIVRVTEHASTALIIDQSAVGPNVGTAARVSAKMP